MEADEIERRDFVTTFRGYDRSAVDAYLKEAAQEVRRLNKELSKARSAAERAEIEKHARPPKPAADKVDAYRQVGEETAKVLMAAEVAANEIRESGRRQATEIIAEARRKAQQLVKEAGEGRRDIEEDINRLRETRAVIAAELEDVKKRLSDAVARLQAPLEPAVREAPAAAGKLPAGGEAAKRTKPAKPPQATPQPKIARSDEPERPAKTPAPSEHPPGHVPAETVEAEPVAPDPSRTNGSRPAEKVAESTVAAEPAAVETSQPPADPVDQLLEEIRQESGAQPPPPGVKGAPEQVTPAVPVAVEPQPEPSDAGNEVFDRRARAIEGIPNQAARRLKRLLQEDQNELLHRIRTQRGKGSVADNMPDPADQKARFNASLQQVLGRAFAEGRKVAGAPGPGRPEGPVGNLIARQVVNPLRAEVEKVVDAGLAAKDTPSAIAERASDVVRVWKGVRTDLLGQAMVYAAFHQGLLDAWGANKATRKKWALSVEERHCPSDICRTNAGQGALGLSATFASGHLAPPAHGGCTCTVEAS